MTKHLRKLWIIISIFWLGSNIFGQDVGVVAKLAPNSGCQLGSSLNVTAQIFNFGSTFALPFNISYQINGNTPVTETVNLGTFNASTSYTHTFGTTANLSAPGVYSIKIYTALASDINNANDTITVSVTCDANSVGGSLPADFSVCASGNSGTLNLGGYTGSILDWEISTDAGTSWSGIGNTTDNQNYNNLTQNTGYRAIVKNGLCPQATSSTVFITVDPITISGSLSGPTSICTPPNSASVLLSGHQGSITDWEFSTDAGSSWTPQGSTSNPLNITNLNQTTDIRAIVQSGACASLYSDTLQIVVVSNLNGGTLTPATSAVCESSNSGNLNLTGYVGLIDHWEYSTDQITWLNIANTTDAYGYSGLTTTTYYRVIVSGCTTDTSSVAEVQVDQNSNAGTLIGTTTLCQGGDLLNLSASGTVASQYLWETSVNSGASWNTTATSSTLDLTNVLQETWVRLIANNGACPNDTSNNLIVLVDLPPSFQSVASEDSLCLISNSDSIVYSGITGTIQGWIYSEDGGITWSNIGATDTVLYVSPLVETIYGLVVSSGVCPQDTFVNHIVISTPSISGYLPSDTLFCADISSVQINLDQNSGTAFNWFYSNNSSGPYTTLSEVDSTLNLTNPLLGYYYAVVTNGVCPSINSDTMNLSFFPANYGINGDTLVSPDEEIALSAFGGISYLWNSDPSIADPTLAEQSVHIEDTITYWVQITDANSCVYQASIFIDVIQDGLEIATLITANGDGFNDFWVIRKPEDYGPVKVIVLNSFGQIVYQNDNYENDWNGSFNGQLLPSGGYFYVVENQTSEVFKGNLNIVGND